MIRLALELNQNQRAYKIADDYVKRELGPMNIDRNQQFSSLINTVWAFVEEAPATCAKMCNLFAAFTPQFKH